MRLIRTAVVLVVCGSVAAGPSAAGAKKYAPPGKAGTSEYAETLPAAGGNVAPPSAGGGKPTGAALSKLGSGKVGAVKLSKLGKAGQSAAAFARATAPVTTPAAGLPNTSTASQPGGSPNISTAGQAGGSALSGLLNLLGGSDAGGIGVFLPLLLAFGLGAAVAGSTLRVLRRRQPPV